ncbi:hypothetical protein [Rhodococcus indonesiensis]
MRRGQPALRMELSGHKRDALVIGVDDAEQWAERLRTRAARLISPVLDVGGRALVGGTAFPGPLGRIGQDVVVGTSGAAVGVCGGRVAVAVGSGHVAS